MLYRCLYDEGASYISEFFNFKDVPYNLRGLSTRLDLPPFNLEFMHRSFTFLASKLWNALPPKVRESQDIASFKRSLKAHMAQGVVLVNFVNSFSFRFCFQPFCRSIYSQYFYSSNVQVSSIIFFLIFNFLICIHVHVLTRTLVLLGVTCLNKGFDLI